MNIKDFSEDKCRTCQQTLTCQFNGISMTKYCSKDHMSLYYRVVDMSAPVSEWRLINVLFKYRFGRKLYEVQYYPNNTSLMPYDKGFFISIRRHGVLIMSMFEEEYYKKLHGKTNKEIRDRVELLETFT